MYTPPHDTGKITVKRLLMREVVEQHEHVVRPYASNYTSQERMRFDEVTQGGLLIDAPTLSGIANAILRPIARGAATANIANGWNNRRFYYMMEVDIRRTANSVSTEIVAGYTDYLGASLQTQAIDPNLKFYVNSQIVVSQVYSETSTGPAWVPMVSNNNQVVVPALMSGASTQRPTDLFNAPLIESTITDLMRAHGAVARPNVIGGDQVKLSRRSNLTPGEFLSSTLNAQRQSRGDVDFLGDADESRVLSGAASITSEADPTNSTILRTLMKASDFLNSGFFTYGDLLAMDDSGNLDSRVTVVFSRPETEWDAFNVHNTQHWAGGDATTLMGNKLASQFTKLAWDNLTLGVEFTATNLTPTHTVQCLITNMHLFSPNLDSRFYLDRVTAGIEGMVLAESAMMPGATISIRGAINPMGTTRMFVSIDGEPEVPFSFAVFGDTSVSPIMNPNMDNVMALSKDIRDLSFTTDHNYTANYTTHLRNKIEHITPSGVTAPQGAPSWGLQTHGNMQASRPRVPATPPPLAAGSGSKLSF